MPDLTNCRRTPPILLFVTAQAQYAGLSLLLRLVPGRAAGADYYCLTLSFETAAGVVGGTVAILNIDGFLCWRPHTYHTVPHSPEGPTYAAFRMALKWNGWNL